VIGDEGGDCDEVICAGDEVNQEGSGQNEVDGLKKGADTKTVQRLSVAPWGATENAGVENAIRAKMQGWKMQE